MRSSSDSGRRQGAAHRSQADLGQCDPGPGQKTPAFYVVGIGPGALEHLSGRALEVLDRVEVVAGYSTYLDLIRPLLTHQEIICSGMKQEVKRVNAAVDQCLKGRPCALICSGDPGIYALAGLVLESCEKKGIRVFRPRQPLSAGTGCQNLRLEVVPGIPALAAGASLLGAPLTHDFAVISLSDLLTPWAVIEARLDAAAKADFVIVLHNPKSKKRDWQLAEAIRIIGRYRGEQTVAGIVTKAMRPGQSVHILSLPELAEAEVGMQSTVFIGSSQSRRYMDFILTPRGYAAKYELEGRGSDRTERTVCNES